MCYNPERQQQSRPLVYGEYLNHWMKIIALGVEKLKRHLSSAPRFCECDRLLGQLSVHINAGSKAMGRGKIKPLKSSANEKLGVGFETGTVWDGEQTQAALSQIHMQLNENWNKACTPRKDSTWWHPSTGWQLKGQRRHTTAASWKHLVPVRSCGRTFVFFEFLRQIFTSRSLGFNCPTGGQSENRYGMAGCDGRKTSHDGGKTTLEANWDGAWGEQPLSISCGGVI